MTKRIHTLVGRVGFTIIGLTCAALSFGAPEAGASPERSVSLLMEESDKSVFGSPFVRSGFDLSKKGGTSAFAASSLLTTSQAVEYGKSVFAKVVVQAIARSSEQGKIRSTSLLGHASEVHLRIWDVASAELVLDRRFRGAGYGKTRSDARAMSLGRARGKSIAAVDTLIARVWPTHKGESASLLSLRLRGAGSWRPVSSVLQKLARTPGIVSIHTLDVRSGRIRFQLRSQQSVTAIVSSLRRTKISGGAISVQHQGNAIELTFQMNSGGAPNG